MDGMDESDNVIVATIHAVKGLEFRAVFLPALEERIFPISRAIGEEEQMEEERRLMYVGITRAKEKLFLTNCTTRYLYGHRDYMMPSRFLGEAGFGNKFERKTVFNNFASRTVNSQVDFIKSPFEKNNFDNNNFGNNFNAKAFMENKTETVAKNRDIKYQVGQTVCHKRFGKGKILSIDFEERTGDIDFEGVGVKTLMLDIAPLETN